MQYKKWLSSPQQAMEFSPLNYNIKYFDDLENKYKNIKKSSYANIYQITTIDKSKIVNPMNHLDPIKRIKAPDSVMDKIDKGIIEAFTQTKEKQ